MTARRKFSPEIEALIASNVATWPELTPERMHELRRLLLPSANRIRQAAAETQAPQAGEAA